MKITLKNLKELIKEVSTSEPSLVDLIENEDYNALVDRLVRYSMSEGGYLDSDDLEEYLYSYYKELNSNGKEFFDESAEDISVEAMNTAKELADKKNSKLDSSLSKEERKVLKAIGFAFTRDSVSPDDLPYVQVKRTKNGITMEDSDHHLGNMTVGLSAGNAKQFGLTLDQIWDMLMVTGINGQKGSKFVRRKRPNFGRSMYD